MFHWLIQVLALSTEDVTAKLSAIDGVIKVRVVK